MGPLLPLAGLLLPAPALAADCPRPTTTADLVAALDRAKDRYSDLDVDGFQASMVEARAVVPCLREEMTRHLSAELHRFEGLMAFVDRDPSHSTIAFAAARALEPNYRFPESVVPAGNPVLTDYDAIDPDSVDIKKVAEPMSGRISFDGRPSVDRPETFPTVVQLVDESGAIKTTGYLWPGDPLPKYVPKPASAQVSSNGNGGGGDNTGGGSVIGVVRRGPDKKFLIGAGVAGAVAGALYGGAFVVHSKYMDEQTPIDKLNGLRTTNNSLVLASGVSVAAAVGLGTSAFLVARF